MTLIFTVVFVVMPIQCYQERFPGARRVEPEKGCTSEASVPGCVGEEDAEFTKSFCLATFFSTLATRKICSFM